MSGGRSRTRRGRPVRGAPRPGREGLDLCGLAQAAMTWSGSIPAHAGEVRAVRAARADTHDDQAPHSRRSLCSDRSPRMRGDGRDPAGAGDVPHAARPAGAAPRPGEEDRAWTSPSVPCNRDRANECRSEPQRSESSCMRPEPLHEGDAWLPEGPLGGLAVPAGAASGSGPSRRVPGAVQPSPFSPSTRRPTRYASAISRASALARWGVGVRSRCAQAARTAFWPRSLVPKAAMSARS